MNTKREVLKYIAKTGSCPVYIDCTDCPYKRRCYKLLAIFRKIGARKLLEMFPEKREFDKSKILTCVTADQAKVGMCGYFGNSINEVKDNFIRKNSFVLETINENIGCYVFDYTDQDLTFSYPLFYPIDEEEE